MLIYRWYPHGSKKPEDLLPLTDYKQHGDRFGATNPIMVCHDQEPLMAKLYSPGVMHHYLRQKFAHNSNLDNFDPALKKISQRGLGSAVEWFNVYDRVLLLHSEQNSKELGSFQDLGFVPVYYWSHALIARDWFRYAQHDIRLTQHHQPTKTFLVYNRAWSGSREYRLYFAQGLVDQDLVGQCHTSFADTCDGTHYSQHRFLNSDLKISRFDLENHFSVNTAPSWASADYDSQDYVRCMIEVVLETLLDDARWHLTEKSLRPIACGRPFVLASTPGALSYVRSYGFQTFHPWIDETYDTVTDPRARIDAIQREMCRIRDLSKADQQTLQQELYSIARRNQTHFFSDQFHHRICQEYRDNLEQALTVMKQYRGGRRLQTICDELGQVVGRDPDVLSKQRRLQALINCWNQDPGSVPENW